MQLCCYISRHLRNFLPNKILYNKPRKSLSHRFGSISSSNLPPARSLTQHRHNQNLEQFIHLSFPKIDASIVTNKSTKALELTTLSDNCSVATQSLLTYNWNHNLYLSFILAITNSSTELDALMDMSWICLRDRRHERDLLRLRDDRILRGR